MPKQELQVTLGLPRIEDFRIPDVWFVGEESEGVSMPLSVPPRRVCFCSGSAPTHQDDQCPDIFLTSEGFYGV